MTETVHTIIHHVDYYPLRIRVYRNGDVFDPGRLVTVTRKQYKHWIVFLDALTEMLRTSTAIRRIFTVQGTPVLHFDDLETNGEYVAVENGPFINVPYGQSRFTMRGKRYNPIIKVNQGPNTFLNSAESMDIYLKKEGYGTITGLPYPFDGILTRSPSASQLQFKHMQSHIPPLKIGGSMEHLNELGGTATWLGTNEKWMMGERVAMKEEKPKKGLDSNPGETSEEGGRDDGSRADQNRSKSKTKLPRLLNSTSSSKRGSGKSEQSKTSSMIESLPPIDTREKEAKKKENDAVSVKTEEECVSIQNPQETVSESKINSRISRKPGVAAPAEDEIRYHRSYQVTETYVTTARKANENQELSDKKDESSGGDISEEIEESNQEKYVKDQRRSNIEEEEGVKQRKQQQQQQQQSMKPKQGGKRERAKWTESKEMNTRRREEAKSKEHVEPEQKRKTDETKKNPVEKMTNLDKFDADISTIPIRTERRLVTSRSTLHLFVDEIIGEEIEDVLNRAKLWEDNRRRQKMKQQCTQTTPSRSQSLRRHVQLFDPDFD
ncbi:unnamed protein product [Caenorhabditis bovis]|uniref:Doublecortin domain-containing protein n=1 Tax=Caenorhabditis bovis TaxID=2654633 RepID=A0A8S1EUV6_9PELO|nr:unnamed protein product [Caenorhabditis bovis]